MKGLIRKLLAACAALVLLLAGQHLVAAPPTKVVVEAATPSTGEQGTTELDVVITGSGFDSSAAVTFLVSGSTTDTGDVVVQSVTVHDSKRLTARVSLTNAKLADFDVMVRLVSGRNGKGITLFKVVAKGGGGSGDSTAPAPIADLTVHQTIYALALRFTATGDDGVTGTATGYDVRYQEAASQACPTEPDITWQVANRSATTTPYAAGTDSMFAIRPLTPGTSYCIAIRVRDEASNYSAWVTAPGATLDEGTWQRADFPGGTAANPFHSVSAGSTVLGVDGPVMGWSVLQSSSTMPIAVFAGETWRKEVDLTGSFQSVASGFLKVAAVPGSSVSPIAAVMAGIADASGTIRYVLIEGAGPTDNPITVTTIASSAKHAVGALDRTPDSAIAFVPGQDGGWNPVVTLDRVEALSNKSKTSSLRVAERDSSGQWNETPVLYRTGTGITVGSGYFNRVQLIAKPGGKLGLLAEHCKIMVYAERDLAGHWAYFDAGPLLDYGNLPLLALDGSGGIVLASRSDVDGMVNAAILVARESGFVALPGGAPPATCVDVVASVATNLWESVVVPDDPIGAAGWYPRGVTEMGGATFIAAQKRGEMRIVYRCHPTDPWAMSNVTRIDQGGSMFTGPVLDTGGNTLVSYSWGHNGTPNGPWIDEAYLAKATGNACGVVPQP